MNKKVSLFDDLAENINCLSLSDMKIEPFLTKALNALCVLKLSNYRTEELEELAEYILGERKKFVNAYEAECYFSEKLLEHTRRI